MRASASGAADFGWLGARAWVICDRNGITERSVMPTPSAAPISPDRLMQFAFGFAPPLISETAIRHGVFAVLAEGAKSLAEVCAETDTSALGLRAVLMRSSAWSCRRRTRRDATGSPPKARLFWCPARRPFTARSFCSPVKPCCRPGDSSMRLPAAGGPKSASTSNRTASLSCCGLSKSSSRFITALPDGWGRNSGWRKPWGRCPCSIWQRAPAYGASLSRSNRRTCG